MLRTRLGVAVALVMASSVLSVGAAVAETVDCDAGGSLQAAVDAALPDSLVVFTGTCMENLVFATDDVVDVLGSGDAIIDGSGALASAVTVPTGAVVGLFDVTITGGRGEFGGGIDNRGDLTVFGSTIEFNTASAAGGGIDSIGPLGVFNSIVRDNTAGTFGGGIVNREGATLSGVELVDNVATDGGGVANFGTQTLFIGETVVADNEATFGRGGGIYNDSDSDLYLSNTLVSGNETLGGLGGGLYNGEGAGGGLGRVIVTDSEVSANGAGGGGGIYNDGGNLSIADSTVSGHASSAGGGISNAQGGSVSLLRTELVDNSGGTGGGAIFSDSGTVDVIDSLISGNDAPGLAVGGGILNSGDGSLLVDNTTLSDNTAGSGGAIFNEAPALAQLFDTTVTGNTATGATTGGGVMNAGGTAAIAGSILSGNTSSNGPDCAGAITSAGYNLVQDIAGCGFTPLGTDLTGVDPLLGPLADNGGPTMTHALLPGSPAIDHLPPGPVCGGGGDQRGIARPRGAGCDIGAFELDQEPDVVLLVEPNGRWHIRQEGQPDYTFFYGNPGDVPLFGDWDGDGIDTPGMWRPGPGGGFAYLTDTLPDDGEAGVAEFDFFFGAPGDEVFSGDWNGDGIDTLGINRAGHIFLSDFNGSDGDPVPTNYDFFFGVPGDRAFGGDADGDNRDGIFLYRETDGFVYYTNETPVGPGAVAATADRFYFGIASDSFVSGDWDGDQDDTSGIFRGSNTTVFLSNTNASNGAAAPTDQSYVWGTAGWKPVAGVWE